MATNENNLSFVKPAISHGIFEFEGLLLYQIMMDCGAEMGTRKFGAEINRRSGRRALGQINQNLIGADSQRYHCGINKRAMTGELVIYDENIPNPLKRPITRKFAAQFQKSQEQQQNFPVTSNQENEKPEQPVQNPEEIEDCKIIEVEDYKTVKDQPVPMSPDQTVSLSSDKNQMEVEMEDIFEEPVMDIDGCDAKNPLAVVDYVSDLYAFYTTMETASCAPQDYMTLQCDINDKMRSILIDWLIEVHYKFDLREETLFLTVNLIDRFLAKYSVVRKKLQLVGLVAMLLACKYEEVSVPVVDDLIFISDKAYSRKELLDMEKVMLNTLQFNMSLPTPYVFIRRFLKAAESDKKLELLSFFIIELSLVEYEMLKYPPSLLAAAAVYTAQCSLYGFKQWNKTCEWYSNYPEDQLQECSRLMVGYHQRAGTGKLTGVHRKYSTSKYGHTIEVKPASFLLEEETHQMQWGLERKPKKAHGCVKQWLDKSWLVLAIINHIIFSYLIVTLLVNLNFSIQWKRSHTFKEPRGSTLSFYLIP
ncbi:uncharacterized protein [Phyllobates terribilis]|uniref:uncharacterized protein n=1 Tax=Phyllobates terribilis TaxID=111132 RepID=UPI003CCB520A